jgi:heat shock protein HslJ
LTHGTPWALAAALLAGCAGASKPAPQAALLGRRDHLLVQGNGGQPGAGGNHPDRLSGTARGRSMEEMLRMAATLMACADPALMAQERRFLQVLERVDRAVYFR